MLSQFSGFEIKSRNQITDFQEETKPCSDVGQGKEGLSGNDSNNELLWEEAIDTAITKKVISMLLCIRIYMKTGTSSFALFLIAKQLQTGS